MIKAFIFDLDGTLLDSEVLWVEATAMFIKQHDPDIPGERIMQMVYGKSWYDIYEDICNHLDDLHMTLPEMEEALRPYFLELARTRDIRIPGSIDLLKRLAETCPVCIVSGSPGLDIQAGIELMGIADALQFYLGAEDYSPGKPDPTCFLAAAERLGVPPADCVVFEDSAAGIEAAKRAGMCCVALVQPHRPRQDVGAADLVLADLNEFDVNALPPRAT